LVTVGLSILMWFTTNMFTFNKDGDCIDPEVIYYNWGQGFRGEVKIDICEYNGIWTFGCLITGDHLEEYRDCGFLWLLKDKGTGPDFPADYYNDRIAFPETVADTREEIIDIAILYVQNTIKDAQETEDRSLFDHFFQWVAEREQLSIFSNQ